MRTQAPREPATPRRQARREPQRLADGRVVGRRRSHGATRRAVFGRAAGAPPRAAAASCGAVRPDAGAGQLGLAAAVVDAVQAKLQTRHRRAATGPARTADPRRSSGGRASSRTRVEPARRPARTSRPAGPDEAILHALEARPPGRPRSNGVRRRATASSPSAVRKEVEPADRSVRDPVRGDGVGVELRAGSVASSSWKRRHDLRGDRDAPERDLLVLAPGTTTARRSARCWSHAGTRAEPLTRPSRTSR